MNEAEIITNLRLLSKDLKDLGASPLAKETAGYVLASKRGACGGALVQWYNRETDSRRKIALRQIIKLVVKAGVIQGDDAIAEAVLKLSSLIDRIEIPTATIPPVIQTDTAPTDPWVLIELADCKFGRSTMLRHKETPETTGVRKIGRGKYEIRRSRLAEYLDVRHRRKYGIE